VSDTELIGDVDRHLNLNLTIGFVAPLYDGLTVVQRALPAPLSPQTDMAP
jgi:hypothetical protein